MKSAPRDVGWVNEKTLTSFNVDDIFRASAHTKRRLVELGYCRTFVVYIIVLKVIILDWIYDCVMAISSASNVVKQAMWWATQVFVEIMSTTPEMNSTIATWWSFRRVNYIFFVSWSLYGWSRFRRSWEFWQRKSQPPKHVILFVFLWHYCRVSYVTIL